MEYSNSLNKDIEMDNNNTGLSYKTHQEQAIYVSKVADFLNNMLNKYVLIEHPILSLPHGQTVHPASDSPYVEDTVININLPYDPNTPMEHELWDGNFYPISLHNLIEHLVLDSKNIKNSLNFMAKYISNKQVNFSKSNNIEDFHSIGKAIWNFIFSIYQAKWDLLYADKYSNTLRKKISAKFTPKISSVSNKSNKATNKLTLASIEKIPPLFLPNCRRRLTKSPNTSKISNWLKSLNSPKKLMLRL